MIYLYKEWYSETSASIWMRGIRANTVCRYRTTMMAESHYRILKRDFLSLFGRPVFIQI